MKAIEQYFHHYVVLLITLHKVDFSLDNILVCDHSNES